MFTLDPHYTYVRFHCLLSRRFIQDLYSEYKKVYKQNLYSENKNGHKQDLYLEYKKVYLQDLYSQNTRRFLHKIYFLRVLRSPVWQYFFLLLSWETLWFSTFSLLFSSTVSTAKNLNLGKR